jgi:hypothetical protein
VERRRARHRVSRHVRKLPRWDSQRMDARRSHRSRRTHLSRARGRPWALPGSTDHYVDLKALLGQPAAGLRVKTRRVSCCAHGRSASADSGEHGKGTPSRARRRPFLMKRTGVRGLGNRPEDVGSLRRSTLGRRRSRESSLDDQVLMWDEEHRGTHVCGGDSDGVGGRWRRDQRISGQGHRGDGNRAAARDGHRRRGLRRSRRQRSRGGARRAPRHEGQDRRAEEGDSQAHGDGFTVSRVVVFGQSPGPPYRATESRIRWSPGGSARRCRSRTRGSWFAGRR